MKIIPEESICYKSHLEVEENIKRISSIIEPPKTIRFLDIIKNKDMKPYEGEIKGSCFVMNRILKNERNSWNPIISGCINNNENGSIINVEIKLTYFVRGFTTFWLYGVVTFWLIALIIQIFSMNFHLIFLLMPIIMFIFGLLLTKYAFEKESEKTTIFLKDLFEAEIIK